MFRLVVMFEVWMHKCTILVSDSHFALKIWPVVTWKCLELAQSPVLFNGKTNICFSWRNYKVSSLGNILSYVWPGLWQSWCWSSTQYAHHLSGKLWPVLWLQSRLDTNTASCSQGLQLLYQLLELLRQN